MYFELMPCPFCGCKASFRIEPYQGKKLYTAECANDDCSVSPMACDMDAKKVLNAWNKRFISLYPTLSVVVEEEEERGKT